MADLEQINQAQLDSALTTTEGRLQRRLSNEDGLRLTALMEQLQRRYPNQDNAASIAEYLTDLEQLSLKFSLQRVEEAIAALRIDPAQEFFPSPTDVAAQIQRQKGDSLARRMEREAVEFIESMNTASERHNKFMCEWEASGLSLADFCGGRRR